MNMNMEMATIDTNRALADILDNFSGDYINDLISKAFIWKFRPYENEMPNYALLFEQKYTGIKDNYTGPSPELIEADRQETYRTMIDVICSNYNLDVDQSEIPDENTYSLCYALCQILLSEFTDRLVAFFTNYIVNNMDDLIASLPEDKRNIKSSYSKKVYTDPKQICIYENMALVLDMVASLDIPFHDLLVAISDENTANFIDEYIDDKGDIYKYHFAKYILDPATRTQMITIIKLSFVQTTANKINIMNGETGQNPFIV